MEKVSVIIPVYNMQELIEKCLLSVVNQTYRNIEIIIIDDGSTDKSGEICDYYAETDSRIRVFHKENGGIASAYNIALNELSGQYILFVDSDDYIAPNMIEILYELLKRNNADVAQCGRHSFSDKHGISFSPTTDASILILPTNDDIMDDFFHYRNISRNLAARLFLAELFIDVRCDEGRQIIDVVTLPQILKKCNKYVITEDKLYYAFESPSSVSRGIYTNQRWEDRIYADKLFSEFVMEYYPKYSDYLEYRIVIGSVKSYDGICNNPDFIGDKNAKKLCLEKFRTHYNSFRKTEYYLSQSQKTKIQLKEFRISPCLYVNLNRIKRKISEIRK